MFLSWRRVERYVCVFVRDGDDGFRDYRDKRMVYKAMINPGEWD